MSPVPQWTFIAFLLLLVALVSVVNTSRMTMPIARTASVTTTQDAWKIENAMSAAPLAIARNATIMDWPVSPFSNPVLLRTGFNGWTCFPDDPATPVNDPVCADQVFMGMIQAMLERKPFSTQIVGIGYKLQGGATASSLDPFKAEPGFGERWIIDPPHIMLVGSEFSMIGMSTDPSHGGPYVIWSGTSYAHLKIPVVR